MKQFKGKPFLIVHTSTFDLGQIETILNALDLENCGVVTDLLSVDDINILRPLIDSFSSKNININELAVFAPHITQFDERYPEFLQLIYDTVAAFDFEIYFG